MFKLYRSYSQEAISYQIKDEFIDRAEELMNDIYKEIPSNRYKNNEDFVKKSPLIKRLAALITERFGIKCSFPYELSDISIAAVVMNTGNSYVFEENLTYIPKLKSVTFAERQKIIKDVYRKNKESIINAHNKKGYIDLKNAKVGGYYSTFEQFFIFDFYSLKQDFELSPREFIAVMLHEIGHVLHGMEQNRYLEEVNLIFLDIISDINDNRLDRAITRYNKDLKNVKDINALVVSEDISKEQFNRTILQAYIDLTKKQMIDRNYLNTNTEALADNFAAKFGLGSEIVTALSKLHGTYEDRKAFYEGIDYLAQGFVLLFYSYLFSVSIPVFLVIFFYNLYSVSEINKSYTYDDIIDRYKRIRNAMVRMVVNIEKVNLDRAKSIYKEIELIDRMIEQTPIPKDVMKMISNIVIPGSMDAMYYKDLNRMIEDGLSNDLYVQALKIKLS
jgi:hypothetical protein